MGLVQMFMDQLKNGGMSAPSPEVQGAMDQARNSPGMPSPSGQGMGYALPGGTQIDRPGTQAPTPTSGPASTSALPGQPVPGTPSPANQMSAGQQAMKSAGNALQAWGNHGAAQGMGGGMTPGNAASPATQYANPQLMQYSGLASLLGTR